MIMFILLKVKTIVMEKENGDVNWRESSSEGKSEYAVGPVKNGDKVKQELGLGL